MYSINSKFLWMFWFGWFGKIIQQFKYLLTLFLKGEVVVVVGELDWGEVLDVGENVVVVAVAVVVFYLSYRDKRKWWREREQKKVSNPMSPQSNEFGDERRKFLIGKMSKKLVEERKLNRNHTIVQKSYFLCY